MIKGRLLLPPELTWEQLETAAQQASEETARRQDSFFYFRLPNAQVLQYSANDDLRSASKAAHHYYVMVDFDAHLLPEYAADSLVADLYELPFHEVLRYVEALREVFKKRHPLIRRILEHTKGTAFVNGRALDMLFESMWHLFDSEGVRQAVEQELGNATADGTHYLDGWVPQPVPMHTGLNRRIAERLFEWAGSGDQQVTGASIRAAPTRQLHITAGNAPQIPFISLLHAFATKSACVIKCPAGNRSAAAILAVAMNEVDPQHPLARHTSLVYWKGGDKRVEDVLFAPGAFDRVVVWGTQETVNSAASRLGDTKTINFGARYGLSLIGRESFAEEIDRVATFAMLDSLIADQAACTASLVHYVEGTEEEALLYCCSLQKALARWDNAFPHRISAHTVGQLRLLRRSAFLHGSWFENGEWPQLSSLVIFMRASFDLSLHPMSRCIVVRSVDDLANALPFMNRSVSAVGVYPESKRLLWRNALAARGVSTIYPLGEGERVYAGMPHDGVRILNELVDWKSE